MTFDLVSTVLLTAGAAVAIATLASNFAVTAGGRIGIAVALSTWFAVVVALAATQALYYERGALAAPGLGLAVILPIAFLVLLVARTPALRARLAAIPISTLIGINAVRLEGLLFVALYLQHKLPAPFAPSAGWGDVFIGATAVPLAWLASRQASRARPLLWLWNSLGILDLLSAIGLGVTSAPGPAQLIFGDVNSAIMTTLPWLLIPGFLVPLLFCTHIAIAWRLATTSDDHTAVGSNVPAPALN